MSYAIDDPNMPGPGDIYSPPEDDLCTDCGEGPIEDVEETFITESGRCGACQDLYEAHCDDKLDQMRDEEDY